MTKLREDIYATLVDRAYSIPDRDRWDRALMLTWAEFVEVWYLSGTGGRGGERNTRPPTLADAKGSRVIGLPICISDAWDNWPPPSVDAKRYGYARTIDGGWATLPRDPTKAAA